MAFSITVYGRAQTSLDYRVTDFPTDATWGTVDLYLNGQIVQTDTLTMGSATQRGSFSGLTAGTTYTLMAWYGGGSGGTQYASTTATTLSPAPAYYTYYAAIRYDPGIGSGSISQTTGYNVSTSTSGTYVSAPVTYNMPAPPAGFTFGGWVYNGAIYSPGDTITIYSTSQSEASPATITLTARYTRGRKAYIWSGEWKPAIPYIWTGSRWVEATESIYSSGWQ